MRATKQPKSTQTPQAIRVAAGFATVESVAEQRIVSAKTLAKVEAGEPGVNTGTLDDLAALYGVEREVVYAAYAHARRIAEGSAA
jgi:hypothetical protein